MTREEIIRAGFGEQPWYAVRCVFEWSLEGGAHADGEVAYEERVTIWRAASFDEAITLAEAEGHRYVEGTDRVMAFTGLAQAYHLFDDPAHGAEVFSLIRRSELGNDAYLARFFETGYEQTAINE